MCGIAGMIGLKANKDVVSRMVAAQYHRGPDDEGIWSTKGAVLGHSRLKVIDLTDAGHQPMSCANGRFTIVYNGEVYNYRELRAEFSEVVFCSDTDTEVILHAFARWGLKSLERFRGMFAFAIWDERERALFCARDRLGIKPFYYARIKEDFVFASEIKGVLAAGIRREANDTVIYDYLARDFYNHQEETFFEGVYELPPASYMVVRNGKTESPRHYWRFISEVEKFKVSEDPKEREDLFFELSSDAVRSHLYSDVPIGVALSGGLDSATLLALLNKTHPDPKRIESFSFVFADERYSEKPYIEAMAGHSGTSSHLIEVSPFDFVDMAERMCVSQEEPYAGIPVSAYALCIELARQHGFIVMMDGSGIDEGLCGYARFRPAYWADLADSKKFDILDQELSACGITSEAKIREAFLQMEEASSRSGDVGKGQDLTVSVRPDCLRQDFIEKAKVPLPEFERSFPDNLRNLMYRELRYTKLPRALRFRDRLSMMVGVELRPPFLDHCLLAYEFALPPQDRIHLGQSKVILRRGAARLLPDTVRLASKRTVQTPQREWFRNELKEWIRDRIDNPSFWNHGWIEKHKGLKAMEKFFQGEGDNSFFLWQWVNLEMWARAYLSYNHD